MRSVQLPASLLEEMSAHGRSTYPEECCGFLIGRVNEATPSGERAILAVERAENGSSGERTRRFMIPPDQLRLLERRLESTAQAVVGFYHSHPDHPARPSQFDQEHAWPWYTYLVLSVTESGTPAVGAFELDPDAEKFRELRLSVTGPEPTIARRLGRA